MRPVFGSFWCEERFFEFIWTASYLKQANETVFHWVIFVFLYVNVTERVISTC
jgi:hypothetical protein